MPSVSIVIPVYNEGDNIRTALTAIQERVKCEHNILIVYDFDEDNTLPAVKELMPAMPCVSLVKNKYGRGVLNAIKTGLESALGGYVVVTMADLSDPPEVINDMVNAAESERADVVCASRYMKGGRQVGGPLVKGLMSRTAGLTLCWFAGLPTHDATNSFKLYRKSYLDEVSIESTGGFELGLELTVKAYLQGRKICEVPTTWTDRTAGESHFKIMKWLPSYLHWYFMAFRRRKNGA